MVGSAVISGSRHELGLRVGLSTTNFMNGNRLEKLTHSGGEGIARDGSVSTDLLSCFH
jgi:hypothetical protein